MTEESQLNEVEIELEQPQTAPADIDHLPEESPCEGEPTADSAQPDGVAERLAAIEQELCRANRMLERRLEADAVKDDIIARLHKELLEHKDDLHKKIVKPILMDMIVFADSMKALVSRYEEAPPVEELQEMYLKLRREFAKVGGHIDDVLYNYGVEPYASVPGEEFNPRTQQARKNTPADNPENHKKIVASLLTGYTWEGQLLRRESVHVSTCEQPAINDNNDN